MNGMLADVFAEMIHRKGLLIYGVATLFGLLIVGAASTAEIRFEANGMDQMPDGVPAMISSPVFSAAAFFTGFLVFLSVLATSGLLPRVIEKGRVDYFFSKPISRTSLLLSRLVSIFLVYGGMLALSGLVIYGLGAMLTGQFSIGYFAVLGIELLAFAVWLSLVALVGLVSGSQAAAMIAAFAVWIAQNVLQFHYEIAAFLTEYKFAGTIALTLYWILPKTSQLSELGLQFGLGAEITSWAPLLTTLPFGALLLIVALAIINRKDL